MRIAATNPDGGAFKYILDGLGNAFRVAGHQFRNVSQNVGTDWDLYLGCSGWRQKIPPKKHRKGLVGIHVNPYGPAKVGAYPAGSVIDESVEAIQWVQAQQPDFVWCYCSPTFTDQYFGFWETNIGVPVVGLPVAADLTVYRPTSPEPRFACDIGWVGGYWPYKAQMMDPYLVPLLRKYKTQIYGWGGWGNRSRGHIADADVPKLFASAKISPSISEPHSVHHPVDIPERVMKVPACGGFTIHTPSVGIQDLFGDTVPMAKDPTDWFRLIDHYLTHPDEREEAAAWQRDTILRRHTYFDRASSIAHQMGRHDVSDSLMDAKRKYL